MNERSVLPVLLGEFYDKLNRLKEIVDRDIQFPDAPGKIKVAIGMRRAGKTYFLYQQILKMINEGVSKTAILYINFEDDRLLPLNEQKLAKLVDAFYSYYPENHDRKCYLFFDEIQNVDRWPIVIRRLHDTKNADFFLTGSSAKLLSKEIATSLRGRSLAIEIWPYSFNEFIRAKKISIERDLYDKKTQDRLSQIFHFYLSEGGFPEIIPFDPDVKQKTLQEYLDVVIYRDIIERHNIKNPTLIKYVILSMIHNVAKPFAVNKLYNDLKSQGYQVGKDMLYEYVDHIEDAYLAFSIAVYDKSIRKAQTNPKKLYAIDPGMVRALTLDYEGDLGRLFENIVYLDLRRLGCKTNYYLTSERYEIDFLAQTPRGHKKFFQVAWDMQDAQTMDREERALRAGMKEMNIDGEIITLDSYLREGVRL
ncbi:MAG: putative ATPase [Parachlamydiales bacterium]|nr:putative ATPase [Parachlamydiales bacterium]